MKNKTIENIGILCAGLVSIFCIVYGYVMLLIGNELFGRTDTILIWTGGMAFWLGITYVSKSVAYFWKDILSFVTKIIKNVFKR